MITKINIKNFRSIEEEEISFEPLTVLVGANGSGKSNLVKALEFISEIHSLGSDLAVGRQGGREGITPKSIPQKEVSKTETVFSYSTLVDAPKNSDDVKSPRNVLVEHTFAIKVTNENMVKVLSERIDFMNVLYVGKCILNEAKSKNEFIKPPSGIFSHEHNTRFSLEKKSTWQLNRFENFPPLTVKTIPAFLAWLGFDTLVPQIKTVSNMRKIMRSLDNRNTHQKNIQEKEGYLFVDPVQTTICDFSPVFNRFTSRSKSMKRYDLLLNELRTEQPPSDSPQLGKSGSNMPNALKKLIKLDDTSSITRLKNSFETIAPHISGMNPASLRTGKEFIEFVESETGRKIESWESSDGSLRALAILVALESANNGDTIIIEEPEQNLHPWAVRTLIDHIRDVVEVKNLQVVLTTHSEHVLERIKPNELRVASRKASGGTKFHRLDQIGMSEEISMGDVGRLWVKGLLGGVPTI